MEDKTQSDGGPVLHIRLLGPFEASLTASLQGLNQRKADQLLASTWRSMPGDR